jgi:hypothetical protein
VFHNEQRVLVGIDRRTNEPAHALQAMGMLAQHRKVPAEDWKPGSNAFSDFPAFPLPEEAIRLALEFASIGKRRRNSGTNVPFLWAPCLQILESFAGRVTGDCADSYRSDNRQESCAGDCSSECGNSDFGAGG